MKIEKNQIDELNAELTLVIEKEDYLEDFNKQLKTYQQKAQMKGFRKGKTPISVLKKMYGESLMQETVSKVLTDKINDIITGDEFNIIGEPFLIDRENLPQLNHNSPEDYTYKFELGLEPEFEVLGASETDSYTSYEVEVSNEMVDDEIDKLLKRLGEQKSVDDSVKDDDVIYFHGKELYNGKVLVDGHHTEFQCGYDRIAEPYITELKGKKKGDHIDVDIYKLEKDLEAEQVEKYLMKVEEGTDVSKIAKEFRVEITDIVRVTKAELDKETLEKAFGPGEVETEEAAREKIKGYLEEHFGKEADNLTNREIMEALMSVNSIELPEGFLLKWINQGKEEEMTDEAFESFKKELKWRIIKKKLVARHEIQVKEEEIFQYFVNAIRSYSPYIDEATLKNTAFSFMKNKEQVNTAVESLSSGKLFDAIRTVVKTTPKPIDKDGFYELVKSVNQKAQ